jgi:hypothetical protein
MPTSNGVILTDDLRNRTLPIQIRKQPQGYEFREFAGGMLLRERIRHNHAYLQSCIFAIVREWVAENRPHEGWSLRVNDCALNWRYGCSGGLRASRGLFPAPPPARDGYGQVSTQ